MNRSGGWASLHLFSFLMLQSWYEILNVDTIHFTATAPIMDNNSEVAHEKDLVFHREAAEDINWDGDNGSSNKNPSSKVTHRQLKISVHLVVFFLNDTSLSFPYYSLNFNFKNLVDGSLWCCMMIEFFPQNLHNSKSDLEMTYCVSD